MPAFAEKIVPPGSATSQYDAAPLPPSVHKTVVKSKSVKTVKGNLATKKDIKGLSSRIKGLEGQTGRLATETKANSEAVSNMADNMNGLANAMGNTTAATRNLSDRVGNVEKNLVAEAKNLGDQIYGNALFLGIGGLILAVLAVMVILVAISRNRANNANLQPVEDGIADVQSRSEEILNEMRAGFAAVQTGIKDIPTAVKALDPLVIELDDVAGHHVKYDAPIVDNMYVTCYVPSTVTSPVTNPAQIVPTRMTDRGAVRRSVRKTMADYLTKLAANPNPATEQERQQKALIEHLITTGQLVVS